MPKALTTHHSYTEDKLVIPSWKIMQRTAIGNHTKDYAWTWNCKSMQ